MTTSDFCLIIPYLQYGLCVERRDNKMPEHYTSTAYLELKDTQSAIYNLQYIKPYLRHLSSMSDIEKNEIAKLLDYEFYVDDDGALCAEDDRHRVRVDLISTYINYLYSHHFDFNNLIENNIAIEAPQNMY